MEKKTILEKLIYIQQNLKAPKSQFNSFGKYHYRSCEDILESLKPLLNEMGCVLTLSDELVNVGDRYYIKATADLIDKEQGRISNIAYAREEETKKGMDGSQVTGASSSYARKYALNGLFLIDDVKDSDTTNVGEEITKEEAENYTFQTGKHEGWTLKKVVEEDKKFLKWLLNTSKDERLLKMIEILTGEVPRTDEEWDERLELTKKVMEIVRDKDLDIEAICNYYGVESLGDLKDEQIKEIIEKRG